jgi:two-component system sensor histidine kinase BaeS
MMGYLRITSDAPKRPIVVDGKTVGWLALLPFQQATAQADVRFQRQYLTTIWIIGTCIVVLAAFAAWWLRVCWSRHSNAYQCDESSPRRL